MNEKENATVPILLALTAVTGIVDAVSFLSMGRVFTANMTGNVVLLGFALAGAPTLSIGRSCAALAAFLVGAIIGGRMTLRESVLNAARSLAIEAALLLTAAAAATGFAGAPEDNSVKLYVIISTTAVAMGLRNAVVRKLAIPDMTTTVLTLTISGLAADSSLAGGDNPRWRRRCAAILAMAVGALAGAMMLRFSIALPLSVCGISTGMCAFAISRVHAPKQ